MLKFTKHGRTASASSLFVSSRNETTTGVRASRREETTQKTAEKDHQYQYIDGSRPKFPKYSVDNQIDEVQKQIRHHSGSKTHLIRTKISEEELRQLESEDHQSIKQKVHTISSNWKIGSGIDTGEILRTKTIRSRKFVTSESFRSTSKKLTVCNDGYFPKVLPLRKFFAMKRSDSKLLSRTNVETFDT